MVQSSRCRSVICLQNPSSSHRISPEHSSSTQQSKASTCPPTTSRPWWPHSCTTNLIWHSNATTSSGSATSRTCLAPMSNFRSKVQTMISTSNWKMGRCQSSLKIYMLKENILMGARRRNGAICKLSILLNMEQECGSWGLLRCKITTLYMIWRWERIISILLQGNIDLLVLVWRTLKTLSARKSTISATKTSEKIQEMFPTPSSSLHPYHQELAISSIPTWAKEDLNIQPTHGN